MKRTISLFFTIAFLASVLIESAHYLLVEHHYCPQHGELTHAHPDEEVEVARSAFVAREEHGHHHCNVVGCLRGQRFVLSNVEFSLIPDEAPSFAVLTLKPSLTFAQPLFAFAPKNSPPASTRV